MGGWWRDEGREGEEEGEQTLCFSRSSLLRGRS